MRTSCVLLAVLLLAVSSIAQPARPSQPPPDSSRPPGPPGPPPRCCAKAYDATGKLIGDVIRWDDRIAAYALEAIVRFPLKSGGDTALVVGPEHFRGIQEPGGSVALFTTPDCGGPDMFAMLAWPPLTKRYSMVLPEGSASTLLINATHAWLFVTDSPPVRVSPGATVFHSQWSESGGCSPYPAPGYTVSGTPMGGFWMKKQGDLYAMFKRPFYTE